MKAGFKTATEAILITFLTGFVVIHFLLNNPASWGSYEACLQLKEGMNPAEVHEIMGNPDGTYAPDHGRFDEVNWYDRYYFASSGPILVKLNRKENGMVVVGTTCEDLW